MLALDLGVFQRKPHVIKVKEALGWFGFWTGLAFLFNIGLIFFHERGRQAGLEFFTGYLVEKSLSIDNIFVFTLIFSYFRVPPIYQHKVLFWGILGAIIMRAIFIIAGLSILTRFHWTIYVFGSFLLITGINMLIKRKDDYNIKNNLLIKLFKKIMPVTDRYEGNNFFFIRNGKLTATPLFIVLLAVESSDIIFAVDSIPAIFAITSDSFIVYTSNIFALLGLRSLYFAVSGFLSTFYFLHYGFASILIILSIKMLLSGVYKLPIMVPVILIIVILMSCIIISLLLPRKADLKLLFERIEKLKLISFRRLLMLENIIDLGELNVSDAMQSRDKISALRLDVPWEENKRVITENKFSRYPLVEQEDGDPIGIIHVKNLLFKDKKQLNSDRLRSIARKPFIIREDLLLEDALRLAQRSYEHLSIVVNENHEWIGILCIEDILEEIVGRIGDEFDTERVGKYTSLSDALSPNRVFLDLEATSMLNAIKKIVSGIPASELPVNHRTIIRSILKRNAMVPTYFGDGIAVPRCRIAGITKPILVFARSGEGIPLEGTNQRAELIFLLVTPRGVAGMQPHMLADIMGLKESDHVMDRLRQSNSPNEIIEAITSGEQISLD
jgi:tellurite resistance protein TerC